MKSLIIYGVIPMQEYILKDGSIHFRRRNMTTTKKGSSIWLPRLAAQKLSRRRWVRIVVLDDHVELWPDASFLIDGELQV